MVKIKVIAVITKQDRLTEDICDMRIKAPQIVGEAIPGQFLSLYSKNGSKMFPRFISLCGIDREKGELRLVYHVTGAGTKEFPCLKEGDTIDVLGPLGSGSPSGPEKRAFLIGGGTGTSPLLELAKALQAEQGSGRESEADSGRKIVRPVLGYKDNQMFLKGEFEAYEPVCAATKDGSAGTKDSVLDAIREQGLKADITHACGPTPMLRALRAYAVEQGMECWLSLEGKVAYGVGTYLTCVYQPKDTDRHSQVHNKRICKDGPMFLADEIKLQRRYPMMSMSVNVAGVGFKNPVMRASGAFGSGTEYGEFVDLNRLGAVVIKGVANVAWPGNLAPRIMKTYGGMINTIGLQNPGIEVLAKGGVPFLKQYGTRIIVNVHGRITKDYVEVMERLSDGPVDMLETSTSYPSVKEGGIAFGQDPKAVETITRGVRVHTKQPIIMKLGPNMADIIVTAKAAEAGGTDTVSLTNTLTDMKIDVHKRAFTLANRTGGLSGPAIKSVAVRMVYQMARAVKVPIIGVGGIRSGDDALELILAGASAMAIGTASFYNPYAIAETVKGIRTCMERHGIEDTNQLIETVE